MSSLFNLNDKNIIVTGASRGNGLAISNGLIEHGANVIAIDKEQIENPNLKSFQIDGCAEASMSNLVDVISNSYKKIDGLVNNAGISIASNNPYDTMDDYNQTLEINLHSIFRLTSKICKIMAMNSGGSIINITSLGGELGFPDNPSYQISKAGLKQLTKSFACDWGKENIRINNICPGYIRTAMTERSFVDPDLNQKRKNRTMLQRWGNPDDLVGAAIFLLSDASSYVTGTTIYVDGGWTSKGF